jgi:acetyl esterase/lipase
MNRILIIASLFCTIFALLSVIWIIFPAPSYYIWLYSVAVSEWSLWFVLFAVSSVIFAALSKNPTVLYSTIIIGFITCVISLYPYFTSLSAANEKNVTLSFSRYFAAIIGEKQKEIPFQTRVFATNNGIELKLDVYSPTAENRNGKSVIVVHGGSWSGGVRNDFPQWNQWFTDNGFTVFDIDYSLIQPNYLSAIGDVKSAVKWVKNNSAEFNISPDKVILLGRSAGGHLALISAYSPVNSVENVSAVISVYAPTDLIWDYDNLANEYVIDGRGTLSNFLGGNPYQSDEMRKRYLQSSPIENISTETPPTLLIHGGKDQLVLLENMNRLSGKLNELNITNETLYIPYGQHGFDYNFNGWGSQMTKSVILNFLKNNAEAHTQ